MELKRIEAIIEALLFAAGDQITDETLCKILDLDKKTLCSVMNSIMDKYTTEKRGLQVIQINDSFQLCTKPEYFDYIKQLKEPKNKNYLSQAALEVLSIIAYKQPITKSSIDLIRGVGSDTSITKLLERNLILEVGRVEAPGRPILYGTTDDFLKCFGLKSLKELPVLEMLQEIEMNIEENKHE